MTSPGVHERRVEGENAPLASHEKVMFRHAHGGDKSSPARARRAVAPMRWTWLPRYYPDLHASENAPWRFWFLHVPLLAAICGFFALPPVRAWMGTEPYVFFAFVLLHLVAYATDLYVGLYERWPVAFTTIDITINLSAAVCLAALPGRVVLPLWVFYAYYVIYLTRAMPVAAYPFALVTGAPWVVLWIWDALDLSSVASTWPQIGPISLVAGTLYITLAPNNVLQRRIQAELEAARERERIAANLHDTVGTTLAEVALWHDVANLQRGAAADAAFQRARHRAAEALLELRMAVTAMTSGQLTTAQFEALLRTRVESLCDAAGARCHFEIETTPATLTGETPHHLSNLITETVSNALRHGHAKTVAIELRYAPLHVTIRDDGRGFDPSSAPKGHGMSSMRARARSLDAKLEVTSRPGEGTVVELTGTRSILARPALSSRGYFPP